MAIRTEPSLFSYDVTPAQETESTRDLCGEPKYYPVEDEVLGLCYEIDVACGVSKQEGVERFRRSIWEREGIPSVKEHKPHESPRKEDFSFWKGLGEFIEGARNGLPPFLPGMIY